MPDQTRKPKVPRKPKMQPPRNVHAKATPVADLSSMVGQNAYRIRKELGLTQSAMAERTGVPVQSLSVLERGKKNFTLSTVAQVAAAYGVDARSLICGSDYGVSTPDGVTLDTLARLTNAIDARVQQLLAKFGPVSVGQAHLASILGALFDAISNTEGLQPPAQPRARHPHS